jgi:hypothetical protein
MTGLPDTNIIEVMKSRGWQTSGIYWWFEDSLPMTLRDAIYFYKGGL